MSKSTVMTRLGGVTDDHLEIAHLSFWIDGKQAQDALTEQLRGDDYYIISHPRLSTDGTYESVIIDPDGNHIEIVA